MTKRETWEAIKLNMPAFADLILEAIKVFGKPAHVEFRSEEPA